MTNKELKERIIAEIERLTSSGVSIIDDEFNQGYTAAMTDIKGFIDSLPEKPISKIWHNINELPEFINGITPLIVDSNYGHISREAHYYTTEKWEAHIGFEEHREFKWAYESDLIE